MAANQPDPTKVISPKVTAAAVGAAVATIIMTLLAAFVPAVKQNLSPGALIAQTGAIVTVLAFIFGYITRDPLRD